MLNKNKISKPKGTELERNLFTQVKKHYTMSRSDLDARRTDWNTKDELFRSHINEANWPYSSLVFDPRIYAYIRNKTARLFARKPRGRMTPREGGDALGAKINNQLLSYQWDENVRIDGETMLSKWATMDQNTRKYGASFALVPWRYERGLEDNKSKVIFDGPDFQPWNNRDVLHDPSYPTIKKWIQLRDYVTLDELKAVNDTARGKPVYKNLDILKDSLRKDLKESGDTRDWQSRNKEISGLTDALGQDPYNRVCEVITEYSKGRWVTFAPKHGIILRDIPNPYKHGEIPVIQLKYNVIDDDIYGLSDIEPVERIQKALNCLICQYIDTINMSLYAPLKVKSTGVQMHTLEFGAGKKWIMDDPMNVVAHDQTPTGVTEFTATYSFLISAMNNALGESSLGSSNIDPFQTDKTATEVRALGIEKSGVDGFNQMYLSAAMNRQMMLWHSMNQQFMFSESEGMVKVLRVTDKDAIKYFEQQGLGEETVSDESIELLASPELEGVDIQPEELAMPSHIVPVGEDALPKFNREVGSEFGTLLITPEDIEGYYDYITDVESMIQPNEGELVRRRIELLGMSQQLAGSLAQEGYRVKTKELLEDTYEQAGLKDAEKYFEKLEGGLTNDQGIIQINAGGAGGSSGQQGGGGNVQQQGVAGGTQAVPRG